VANLSGEFSNPSKALAAVHSRRSAHVKASSEHLRRDQETSLHPPSGRVVRRIGTTQTLLREAQIDDLVARYQEGEKVTSLAVHFGIHRNTVTAHLRRRGAQLSRGLSDEQISEAGILYTEQQWTLEEIGRKFGVSRRTVGRSMDQAGLLRYTPRPNVRDLTKPTSASVDP
jgi:DNA-directed RNA polymerase specialized sigma24 family protein